ncbi:MAG: hypothetical protein NC121_16670, partial [Blautia sp.]|nr:hypothetical protein [Blautia sp.]
NHPIRAKNHPIRAKNHPINGKNHPIRTKNHPIDHPIEDHKGGTGYYGVAETGTGVIPKADSAALEPECEYRKVLY